MYRIFELQVVSMSFGTHIVLDCHRYTRQRAGKSPSSISFCTSSARFQRTFCIHRHVAVVILCPMSSICSSACLHCLYLPITSSDLIFFRQLYRCHDSSVIHRSRALLFYCFRYLEASVLLTAGAFASISSLSVAVRRPHPRGIRCVTGNTWDMGSTPVGIQFI